MLSPLLALLKQQSPTTSPDQIVKNIQPIVWRRQGDLTKEEFIILTSHEDTDRIVVIHPEYSRPRSNYHLSGWGDYGEMIQEFPDYWFMAQKDYIEGVTCLPTF
jgi:hypothetical protein